MSKYITTAIPYVNGQPHIGHAMDYLIADVCARYYKTLGESVRFQAGTDEHGNKVYQKALDSGMSVQDFVDQNAQKFQDFIHLLNVEYTDFIRTTDPKHEERCQAIWQKLENHIYKSSYEGWYCEGCESFTTDKEYESNQGICPDHQKPYAKLSEENYYLRISDFKDKIKNAIETDEMRIVPDSRKREFLNLLVDMPDVSISRPKKQLSWGVPVPGDDSQVMYVWLDALSNYITVLGYPEQDISDWWPADIQVVGKDILRFHAGIWPAILLGLGLPLPKLLLTHGYITASGEKMSKSIGNVIDPTEVIAKYGVDPFRYFFLRHISNLEDSDFSWEKYDSAYNELANDLGNLVQRLATMCAKNAVVGMQDIDAIKPDIKDFEAYMANFRLTEAINTLWLAIQAINKKIDEQKPWALAKTQPEQAQSVLHEIVQDLLACNKLLQIFLPSTAEKIFDIFSAKEIIPPETPLFPKS